MAAQGAYDACQRLADVVTHNSYITAAGNCGQFKEAQRAYEACIRQGLADVVTYNSYITAAGNCGQFEEAQRAYMVAKRLFPDNYTLDSHYIDLLLYNKNYEAARSLWESNVLLKPTRNKLFQNKTPRDGVWNNNFNFHGLSAGEALLACDYIFNCTNTAMLIIGKGLHSRGNNSKVRNIVFNFANHYGITVRTLENEGRIECSRSAGILRWPTPQGMLTLREAEAMTEPQ